MTEPHFDVMRATYCCDVKRSCAVGLSRVNVSASIQEYLQDFLIGSREYDGESRGPDAIRIGPGAYQVSHLLHVSALGRFRE